MNCAEIETLLDGHATSGLSAAQRSEVDAHLARCRQCADVWLAHETLVGEPIAPPRPGLLAELLVVARGTGAGAGVRAGADAGPRPRRLVSAVGLAAAAAILLLVTGLVLRQPDPVGEGRQLAVTATARNAVDSPAPGLAGDTPIREAAVPGIVAGIQYERLPVPAPTSVLAGRIEVDEFFMFGCGHCFAFEPQFVAWSQAQPANVEIVRVPALFNATARLHARAFYTAEALGVLDTLIEPFYEAIHVRGNALATEADLREFFARLGIGGERFDATFGSAAVAARLAEAEMLNRAYRVDATPSIGVNGKYLSNASMVGSNEALLETVDRLVEFESGAHCTGADPSRCPVAGIPVSAPTPTPTPNRDLFR